MFLSTEDILKIGLAILAGGLIGLEREFRDKAAGFRTNIFICLGATLFTILSIRLGEFNDPARIAANIVVGIGFIGAGVILRGDQRIIGLTTAATIWVVAALGMAIGAGEYLLSGLYLIGVLVILWLFPKVESWIDRTRDLRVYEVTCINREPVVSEIQDVFASSGMHIKRFTRKRAGDQLTMRYEVFGHPRDHKVLEGKMIDNPLVLVFSN